MTYNVLLEDVEGTRELGKRLASILVPGDSVFLSGELGAGKTTLTQGLCEALQVSESVTSPTFSLIHEYMSGKCPIAHFDLYRLNGPEEVLSLGYEDYLCQRYIVIVEWPDRLRGYLPENRIEIELRDEGHGRTATIAATKGYDDLLFSCFGYKS